jgi:large subunit ribosomal protein L13
MNKTYMIKRNQVKRVWYIIDAENKILGRIATRAAAILKGKHKPIYAPHLDTGDGVIVINASKVRVTGRKLQDKLYRRHSGYPGGLREVNLGTLLRSRPTTVVRLAVRRMLPQGPLARSCFKKLKVYADGKHPHKSQNPIPLEV